MGSTHDADFARFLAHSSWLAALARELVRDPATADDAVQETWIAALRAKRSDVTSERGWLATLLANSVRSLGRSETARRDRERSVASAESVDGPDRLVERAEAQRALLAHVLALPEPYRATLLEHYVEERSSAAIARRTGQSESTVRTRIARARAQLRARLASSDERDGAWVLLPLLGSRDAPPIVGILKTGTGVTIVTTTTKCALAAAIAALAWWLWPAGGAEQVAHGLRSSATTDGHSAPRTALTEPVFEDARRPLEEQHVATLPKSAASPQAHRPDATVDAIEFEFRRSGKSVAGVTTWIGTDAWPVVQCYEPPSPLPPNTLAAVSSSTGVARFPRPTRRWFDAAFALTGDAEAPTHWISTPFESGGRYTIELGSAAIRGSVVDGLGRPRPHVGVRVWGPLRPEIAITANPAQPTQLAFGTYTTTDDDGAYKIEGLAAGKYELMISTHGCFAHPIEESRGIVLRDGEERVVEFGAATGDAEWSGRLLNSFGEPFEGLGSLILTEKRLSTTIHVPVALDGTFSRRLRHGTWSIRAHATGLQRSGVEIGSIDIEAVDVVRDLIVPGARLEGRVLDERAAEVNPATGERYCYVIARPRVGGPHFDRHAYATFPGGEYSIDGLEAGAWLVGVEEQDTRFVEVTIAPGQRVATRDVLAKQR